MFCNDVRGNQKGDAQQALPDRAETARAGGEGPADDAAVRWTGQQHLMGGYCGRVIAGVNGDVAAAPAAARVESRPVVLVQRPRGAVVRIGPRPDREQVPAAKAA